MVCFQSCRIEVTPHERSKGVGFGCVSFDILELLLLFRVLCSSDAV